MNGIDDFERAHLAISSGRADDLEACAKVMVDFAVGNNDRDAWMLIFARFNDFVSEGRVPPQAFLRAINDALCTFRASGDGSIDDAFFGKRKRSHPKETLFKYWWARTNASLVRDFLAKHHERGVPKRVQGALSPLDQAIADTIAFRKSANSKNRRGLSPRQIKRQYLRFSAKK